MPTIDYGGLSPWEVAHGNHPYDPDSSDNAENNWDKGVKELYDQYPTGNVPAEHMEPGKETNLYNPGSMSWLTNTPGGSTPPPTPGAGPGPDPGPGPRPNPIPNPRGVPPPANFSFNDPLTKQFEQLLQMQLSMYQQQQEAMRVAAEQAAAKRAQTAAAVDRLSQFMNQRVTKLQGPAYTGSEAEVLRAQLLDPIERDRSAARQRALEHVSARGLRPEDGLAQELMNLVDREYNEYRAKAQGSLASRQIEEQRSREQEAQGLLQYLSMLPDAVARGDLDFVAYVQNLIAQPGQQGLAVGDVLAELPTKRLNDALATLGMGPSIGGASSNAIQMLQLAQNQRAQNSANAAAAWGNIGWNSPFST